jgi:phosphoadenylyl-sulfate reductase (thioredoxin)
VQRAEISRWADELEGASASEILRAAAARFAPRIAFATGFGPEGCVIVDLVARDGLAIELFTLDTGFFFPETYALWNALEARYDVDIRGVRGVPPGGADDGPAPWEVDPDRCCERRKVTPLRAELARLDAWVTAIRRDQTADRATARAVEWDAKFGLVKVNPLVGWTSDDVWSHVRRHDVPVNALHARGYPSIGCAPCTTAVAAGEDPRAGRWRGRAKTECGLHSRAPLPASDPAAQTRVLQSVALTDARSGEGRDRRHPGAPETT